jgi:hypothetical protein
VPFKDWLGEPSISANGRRVSFTAGPASGEKTDVWVRDLEVGVTRLASRANGAGGATGDGASHSSELDADGSRVVFVSRAANLQNGDDDGDADIHVRDFDADSTILVSRANGPGGGPSDSTSSDPDIDDSGTRVSFRSRATNLGDGDTDTIQDVHLRDLAAGTTVLVSARPDGVKGDNDTLRRPTIDASGTRVAFASDAKNLGADGTLGNVFVRDLAAGTLVVASRADGPDGGVAPSDATSPFISPDGAYVAFRSQDQLVAGAPPNIGKTYWRDLAAGRTELVSRRAGADGAPAQTNTFPTSITRNGGCVTFETTEVLVDGSPDVLHAYVRALGADCGPVPPRPVTGGPDGGGAGGGDGVGGPGTPAPGRPGTGGPRAARDTVAPRLSAARLGRRRFRVARGATALAAAVRRGTTLTFRSSEAATLSVLFERATTRRARGRRKVVHKRAGTLTRRITAGAGRIALSGRLGRRRMAAGRYRLTLTARDAAGNRSRPMILTFTIVKG